MACLQRGKKHPACDSPSRALETSLRAASEEVIVRSHVSREITILENSVEKRLGVSL
jgi:hypothetical protein